MSKVAVVESLESRLLLASVIGTPVIPEAATPLAIFTDDFNRPDSPSVGNHWYGLRGSSAPLAIVNEAVEPTTVDGSGGIYRRFDSASGISFTAEIGEMSAYGGLLERYDRSFAMRCDGSLAAGHPKGYGIEIARGDQDYNDSRISLFDGATTVATAYSTFQFGAEISVRATFRSDGSVVGSISSHSNYFSFAFGPRSIASVGNDFGYATGFPDSRSDVYVYPPLFKIALSEATPLLGIDFSGTTTAAGWKVIANSGVQLAIADAWGGRSVPGAPAAQLAFARAAGLQTAAYCLLNFDTPSQDGAFQARTALSAVGPKERPYLRFFAIDVELNPHFRVTQDVITWISQAVQIAKNAHIQPVIYTTRNFWNTVAGNSSVFSDVPLWDAGVDRSPALTAFRTYPFVGGWNARVADQYQQSSTTRPIYLGSLELDKDSCDPYLLL